MIKKLRSLQGKFIALLVMIIGFSQVVLAQTTVTIGTGTSTSATASLLSTSTTTNKYSRHVSVYTAAEITAGGGMAGMITKLAWNKQGTGEYTFNDATMNVWIKEVSFSTHAATPITWATEVSGATPVYATTTQGFTTGTGYKEIVLTSPFIWNGTSNLEIFVEWFRPSALTADMLWQYTAATNANSVTVNSTALPATTARNSNRPNLQITITPLAAIDAGISAFTGFTNPIVPGLKNINATIKNYGTSALTSADVDWSVNGVLGTTFNYTGNLASQGTSSNVIGSYTFQDGDINILKAWTKNINGGSSDPNAGNDTLQISFVSCNPLSGNYTINASLPTQSRNFHSINDFVARLALCGVGGPVIVDMDSASGPYVEQVTINPITGASSTNTITFNGNHSIVEFYNTVTANRHVFKLNGADYITLNNMIIKTNIGASTSQYGWGIHLFDGSDFNKITNCEIYTSDSSTSATNYFPIVLSGSTSTNATAGNYKGNVIENNKTNGGYVGVSLYTASTNVSTGNIIKNNTITNFYTDGIRLYAADSSYIIGNDISKPSSSIMTTTNGISVESNAEKTYIYGNHIHNLAGPNIANTSTLCGIVVTGCDAIVGRENIVANNLVYDFFNNGTNYGIQSSSSDNMQIYNNTVALTNQNTGTSVTYAIYQTTSAVGVAIRNNLVYLTRNGTGNKIGLYFATTGSTIASNNNCIYVGGIGSNYYIGSYGAVASGGATTLTDWKTKNGGIYDQNSVNINPFFLNTAAANYTPTSLALDNLGTPLAAVTTDITGAARHATTPDMGAYEFTPPPPDVGVSAIIAPTVPLAPGTKNIDVTVTNFGGAALTSFVVNWTVNGVAGTPYNYAGSLSQQATTNITLGNYNFLEGVAYEIKAWAGSPNGSTDPNGFNDTTKVNYFSCSPLVGSYTVNQTIPASATNFTSISDFANRLSVCGIAGAVTLDVDSLTGPYKGFSIGNILGSSSLNTITINGHGNEVMDTITAAKATSRYLLQLNGAQYVTVQDFKFTLAAPSTQGYTAHITNGASNNIIRNNTFVNSITTTATSYGGIVFNKDILTLPTTAGVFTNNIIENNTVIGGYYGIISYGTTGQSKGNIIRNNKVLDFYSMGIYIYATDSSLVSGNEIYRKDRTAITSTYSVYLSGNTKKTIIEKNRVHDVFNNPTGTEIHYGFYATSNDAVPGEEVVYRNNLMYNIKNNGSNYGFYNSGSNSLFYYNNTIIIDNPGATAGLAYGLYQTTAATGIDFKNNLIFIKKGGSDNKYALYHATSTSVITSDYNNLYVDQGVAGAGLKSIGYNGSGRVTLSDWQTATTKDISSVNLNPFVVSPVNGNYSPNNMALDDKGVGLALVTDDINGTPRNPLPDIGAYEFTVYNDDAGITGLTSKVICAGNNPVFVDLRNYGVSQLMGVTIQWSVNGVAQTPFTFTGTLDYNTEGSVNIGNYTFLAGTPYNLKVWTSLPNGAGDLNTGNDTLKLNNIKTGLTGTFTVGGAGANYPTISAAVAALDETGVCGPVVFNINPSAGPYIEQVNINTIRNSSAVNTVTINGHGAVVRYTATTTTSRHVIKLSNADYIILDSLNVEVDAAATYGYGIQITSGSDHNIIRNSTIKASKTITTSANTAGIVFSGFSGVMTTVPTGDAFNYNLIEKNTVIGGYYAIAIYGNSANASAAIGNTIRNNNVQDAYTYLIYTTGCDSTIIYGNDISRPTRTSVTAFYGVYAAANSYKLLIEKNKIHNPFDGNTASTSAFYGIYMTGTINKPGRESIIKNNLIYNVNNAGAQYGFDLIGSDSVWIYNNTAIFDNTSASTSVINGFLQGTTVCKGIELKNNLFYITRPGNANRIGEYWTTATSTFVSDYNNYYITGGTGTTAYGFFNGVYHSLSSWKAQGYDQNSYALNPLFNVPSQGVYLPRSGGMDNKGMPLPVVTHDIRDSLRSTTPDIGAFEFTGVAEDVSITGLAYPAKCAGTIPVTVTLSNAGANDLGYIIINWSVNGVLQTPDTISSLLIPSGQSGTVLAGNYNFLANTDYALKFWATEPNGQNDGNHSNDTLKIPLYRTALSGTFTVGGAGADYPSVKAIADALNISGICGPVVINVNPTAGPYNDRVVFNEISGASAVNTITLKGHNAVLTYNVQSTNNRAVLHLNGTDYMTIDSISVEVDELSAYGYSILLRNANYNIIKNSTFVSLNGTSSNYAGLVISGAENTISSAANSKYNIIENNFISGGYYGLSVYGASGSNAQTRGNIIRNNTVRDFYTYGIYTMYSDSTQIVNNDISRPTAENTSTAYGIYVGGASQEVLVEKNRIHNLFDLDPTSTSSIYGIEFTGGTLQAGKYSIVKNNLLYNLNNSGVHYCLYNSSSNNVYYYHNTIVSDYAAATAGAAYGFYQTGAATGIDLQNNIFYVTKGGSGVKEGIHMVTATTGLTSNYNNFYVPTGSVGYNGAAKPTLADWQAVANNDTDSYIFDPVFTLASFGNYIPTSASMNNKGNFIGVVDDIEDSLRSITTPDIGAYEYTPVNNDMGIASILYPSSSAIKVCGNPSDSIVVVIKNYGAMSQTGFNVKAVVSGITTATLTKNYNQVLASGASDTIALGTYNSNFTGGAQIKLYTDLTGDAFHPNDTTVANINLSSAAPMPAASNTSVCRGSQATLVATTPLPVVKWYDAPAGGNLLATNDTLITPVINGTQKYYAEAIDQVIAPVAVGPVNTSIGAGALTNLWTYQVLFTVNGNVHIDSIAVFPAVGSGVVAIRIRDGANTTTLQTRNFNITATTTGQKIFLPMNMDLGPGSYRIDAGGGTTINLFRNTAGATYPYTSPDGAISITGHTFSGYPQYHYYFYDWRIKAGVSGCPSPRKEVTVTTLPEIAGSSYAQSLPYNGIYKTGNSANPDGACAGDTLTYEVAAPTGFNANDFGTTWTIHSAAVKTNNNHAAAGTFTVTGRKIQYIVAGTETDSTFIISANVKDISGTICDTTMMRYIHVYPLPVVDFGPDTTLCNGQVLTLTAPSGISYLWSTGETTQSINVITDGNYSVSVTNEGGCSSSDAIHATFKPSPAANLDDDTTICSGSILVLDAGNPGNTYLWSTGETTQTINVTAAGTYSVRVTGGNACFMDDTTIVSVNPSPVVDLGDASMDICVSNPVTLDAGNPGSTYLWSTGATTQTIVASLAGTYKVTVTNALGCSASDSVIITNKPTPNSDFTVTGSGLQANFTSTPQGGVSYSWNFGDNTTSQQPNPTHTYATAGTYQVILMVNTVATTCKSWDTMMVTVPFPTTGLGQNKSSYELSAYPNPFSDKTQIVFNLPVSSEVTLEVYDVIGKKVSTIIEKEWLNGKQTFDWNIDNNNTGVYFVRLTVNGNTSILRLNNLR